MKKWFLSFGLGFLAVFFVACGGSSPKDVAVEATEAAFKGDSKKYLSYVFISEDARKMGMNESNVEGKVQLVVQEAKKQAENAGGVKKIEVLSEEINGDTARVGIRVHFKNGQTSDNTTTKLRKIGNEWKLE